MKRAFTLRVRYVTLKRAEMLVCQVLAISSEINKLMELTLQLRNVPIARALASAGANVNAREGRSGKTALMTAIEFKATEVITFLCEECNTLSIDIENYSGMTAYQICLLTAQDDLAEYFVSKFDATPFLTTYDSDMDYDDSSSDSSFADDMEKSILISKIAEIAVN